MDATEQIVVGVDGSPEADLALRWAATRARHTQATLRLVHAYAVPLPVPAMPVAAVTAASVSPDDYVRAGEAILGAAAERAGRYADGVEVRTELRVGGAAQALIDAAPVGGLVVVGSRGLGGFSGLLLGSVGVQVSSHARCPTVVVRTEASEGPVVVGVDGSEASDAALAFGFAEADRLGTGVLAVHAWGTPLPTGPGEAAALALVPEEHRQAHLAASRQLLTDALAPRRRRFPDVPVQERLVEASAAPALLDAAEGAALAVVGSRGHGGFAGLLLGSTSQALLHHAGCPVAITRQGQGTSAQSRGGSF
ncbi:universal stress protein [Plantactinospora sp. WMMC1484]|uniref:universal stress protein n=1 Tax=Plantactinospora sp. WMMC1484 TaxID=3404122 RepID=UPI003BF55D9C